MGNFSPLFLCLLAFCVSLGWLFGGTDGAVLGVTVATGLAIVETVSGVL